MAPQAHAPTRIWAPGDVSINEVCASTGQAIDLPRASSGKTQGSFALGNKPILFMCVHIVCALVCCLHTLSKRPMCLLWRCPRAAFTDSREASPYLEAHVGGKGGRPTKSTDHCVKCGSTVCVGMCELALCPLAGSARGGRVAQTSCDSRARGRMSVESADACPPPHSPPVLPRRNKLGPFFL